MTDRQLAELYRAAMPPPPHLDAQAEAQLQAALLGGGTAEQREAGLELLARLPQGPALARLMAAVEPESARLGTELRAARTAAPQQRNWRKLPVVLAMAASVTAVAIIISSVGDPRVQPGQPAAEHLTAADVNSDRILIASFENERSGNAASEDAQEEGSIFRASFGT
jgi:hypothetical protein